MANPRSVTSQLALLLSTGFGAGYSPVMPGTVGACWGIPLSLAIYALPGVYWQLGVLLLLAVIGIPLCGIAAQALGQEDPGAVVWDEFTTVPFAFFLVDPIWVRNPWVLLAGFALHRLFDITKIPPARAFDRMHGGFGIMADDWVAGAYACLSLHLLLYLGCFGSA